MNKTQTRGNCPCCGREQAVLASGLMSKHGYTVENGWFYGVCGGDRFAPMQVQREVTDNLVKSVREDVAKFERRAADLTAGREILGLVPLPNEILRRGEEPTKVEWKSLPEWQRAEALRRVVANLENVARNGANFANDLEALVNSVHGQPLKVVKVEAGPAPICKGERRVFRSGTVATVRYTEKGRVYWQTEEGRKGWEGVQSWRKMELAP